jgi:hypothetical protein
MQIYKAHTSTYALIAVLMLSKSDSENVTISLWVKEPMTAVTFPSKQDGRALCLL